MHGVQIKTICLIFGHNLCLRRPIFKKFFHQRIPKKTLFICDRNVYVATLPCEIWRRYSEYFTFLQDRAAAYPARETVDVFKQMMLKLRSAFSVAIRSSRRLCAWFEGFCLNAFTKPRSRSWKNCDSTSRRSGTALITHWDRLLHLDQ